MYIKNAYDDAIDVDKRGNADVGIMCRGFVAMLSSVKMLYAIAARKQERSQQTDRNIRINAVCVRNLLCCPSQFICMHAEVLIYMLR